MPFYLRKAKKLGPLRINLSKSGIGASVGVKGARVAVGPRGTIVNMGRGGIYYRKSLGRAMRPPSSSASVTDPAISITHELDESTVKTADVDELIDSSSDEMIAELNGPRGNWLRRLLGLTPPMVLHYDLDPTALETFGRLQEAIQALAQARSVWLVNAMTIHATSAEQKYHSGAGRSLTRQLIRTGRLAPSKITTNVEIFGIDTGMQQLLFFPDRLLIRQRGRYASIAYPELTLAWEGIQFVEDGAVPPDANVLDYTWQYVNKAGGPDRRFRNNRQLPILNYEAVTLTSVGGINLALEVSNRAAAERACSLMSSAIERFRISGAVGITPPDHR